MNRRLVNILGYGVDEFSLEQALDYVETNKGQVVTINPEMILNANKNAQFAQVIKDAELVIPDGIGVEIGLKILGHRVHRIAGVEFGRLLLENFAKKGRPVAMIGARREVLDLAVKNITKEIPNVNLVYTQDGYFTDEEAIIRNTVSANPELVLVALGSPKQELFINKLKSKLPNAVMIGLGGSFDVWAGIVKRAPKIYQKLGLEWLYRAIKEPKRFKRIFPTLPLFILEVIKERIICKINAK